MSEARKKKKKGLRLLLLGVGMVILIAALIVVIQYQNHKREAEESNREEESLVYGNIWDYDQKDIASIQVQRADETVTLYTKDKNGQTVWYQKAHPDASLDRVKSTNLIAAGCKLAVYQLIKEDAAPQERAAFGLQDPYAKITVTLNSGDSKTVWVGDITTTGNYGYIMEESTGNIYSTSNGLRTYAGYSSIELYYTEIQNIYTKYAMGYAYLHKKGEQPIELELHDSNENANNFFYTNSPYRIAQPYDYRMVGVTAEAQGSFLTNLKDISVHEIISIEGTEEEMEAYGIGEEPEYQVRIITYNTDSNGETKQYETDYLFGHTYGDQNEYIYFRQNGDGIIYGVDIAGLTQFSFNSYDYIQKLVFLSNIDLIQSGTMEMNGEKYAFELRQEKDDSDETVYHATVNGKEVDEEKFKTALRGMFLIMSDHEYWQDTMEYDESEKVVLTYQFLDGTDKTLTFYRAGEFSYVIQIQEGLWMTCGYYQFNQMLEGFRDMMATE